MTLGGGWFFEIDAGDDRNLRRSVDRIGWSHMPHSKIIHWHEFPSVRKYLRCWFPTLIIVLGTFNFARCCVRATVIRWQIPIFPLVSAPLALCWTRLFLISPISRVPRFSRFDEKSVRTDETNSASSFISLRSMHSRIIGITNGSFETNRIFNSGLFSSLPPLSLYIYLYLYLYRGTSLGDFL